jgi:CRISPR-associated protein Cas1
LLKTRELAQYLLNKRKDINFSTPSTKLTRIDNYEVREKIIKFPYSKAKKLGINKSTLWYLKQNAISGKPFKIYKKVRERLLNL